MRRNLWFALLLLLLLPPSPAAGQRDERRDRERREHDGRGRRERDGGAREMRSDEGARSNPPEIRYDVATGGLQNVPATAGRTYRIRVNGLNPICYSYRAEVYVRQENSDLSKVVAAFGSLPGSGAGEGANADKGNTREFAPESAQPGVLPVVPSLPPAQAFARAAEDVRQALAILSTLKQAVNSVDAAAGKVNQPDCGSVSSFAAVRAQWDATEGDQDLVNEGTAAIAAARKWLNDAQAVLRPLDDDQARTDALQMVNDAQDSTTELETLLATVVPKMRLAQGTITAAEGQQEFRTEVFLPANTDSVGLTVRVSALHGDPRPAPVEQKVPIQVRRGMRIFVSAGFLASTLRSHDFQRVNRVCATPGAAPCDSASSTYSTYADQTRNRGFAFSPVLQANVAFRDLMSSGVSLHGSVGVAARAVNGSSVQPEFIVGAGTGFVDRLLVTFGVHFARDEKLLIGRPSEVAKTAVPTTITESDAVSTIWRTAFVTTFTLRLNNNK